MVSKDEEFLEMINTLIPFLNGQNSEHYGPKVMIKPRYLILLYIAGQIEPFKTFGLPRGNNIYFSARSLQKVANSFRPQQIKFERSRAVKDHYLQYVGYVIHKPKFTIICGRILTDLVALTKQGKKYCERTIEALLAIIPEQNRPKQKLTRNVSTHKTSSYDENLEKECQSFGLNRLRRDYFEFHKSTEIDFDNWKKGFSFDLPSIKAKRELRREALISDVKSKLENQGKLLIVGQPGSSKTTILMELMCDYFDAGYEVFYNYGMTYIRNVDGLVNFIGDNVRKDKKILVAIDNAHKEKTYSIFYLIDKLSNLPLAKIIMTARKPEFDWLLNGLEKVEEEIRKPIRKLYADPNFIYQLSSFTKEETKEFIKRYLESVVDDEELIDGITEEIYNDTKGDPVLVRFSVFGKGLEQDVAEMFDRYLGSQLERKTMLICSILDISNIDITDELLEKCGVLETAHDLNGSILCRNSDGLWNTKHPRWDLELLSLFYKKKSGTLLEQRKQDLKDSIVALYHLREEKIIYSVIEILYYIAVEKFVPVDVVESVFQQTKSEITRGTPNISGYLVVLSLHVDNARNIAEAYYSLKKDREDREMLDKLAFGGWIEKGVHFYDLGNYKEAIKCFNWALEINPNSDDALFLKSLALAGVGV